MKSARTPKPKEEPHLCLVCSPPLPWHACRKVWAMAGEEQLSPCRSAPELLLLQAAAPSCSALSKAVGKGIRVEHGQCWLLPISRASMGAARTQPEPEEPGSASHFCKANTPKTQELLRHGLANT